MRESFFTRHGPTLLALAFLFLLAASGLVTRWGSASPLDPDTVRRVLEDTEEVRLIDRLGVAFAAGREIGAAADTAAHPPQIIAYNGELSILVGVDSEGSIRGVWPLSHEETPAYWNSLITEDFFARFIGLSAGEDWRNIAAISGATITSEAAARDIFNTARHISNTRYGTQYTIEADPPRYPLEPWALAGLSLCLVLGLVSTFTRRGLWRILSRVTSVAILGIWLNASLSLNRFFDLATLSLPGGGAIVLILLIFSLVAVLVGTNIYCRQLCPFGMLSALAAERFPWRIYPSARTRKHLKILRWSLLGLLALVAALGGVGRVAGVEPFGLLFSTASGLGMWLAALAILLISIPLPRFFCRYICPTGACLELVGRANPLGKAVTPVPESEDSHVTT